MSPLYVGISYFSFKHKRQRLLFGLKERHILKISHVIFGVPLCFLISQNSFDNPCRSVSAQIQLLEKNCIKKTLRYKSMINMLGYFWKIYDTLFAKREEILQKLCNQWFFLFNFTGTFLNNALFKNATITKPQSQWGMPLNFWGIVN